MIPDLLLEEVSFADEEIGVVRGGGQSFGPFSVT
jgi:hypothetical protein